jgi:hypothetical protein
MSEPHAELNLYDELVAFSSLSPDEQAADMAGLAQKEVEPHTLLDTTDPITSPLLGVIARSAAELMACPSCGNQNDSSDLFCASCGGFIEGKQPETESALHFCEVCDLQVKEDDMFCPSCGWIL